MNLIDLQLRQLEESEVYIRDLKTQSIWKDAKWGEISMHQPSNLQARFENSWLIVEVRSVISETYKIARSRD